MNNNCEYASGEYCMCDACQSMRKTLEEVEKIPKEKINEMFARLEQLADKTLEDCKWQE